MTPAERALLIATANALLASLRNPCAKADTAALEKALRSLAEAEEFQHLWGGGELPEPRPVQGAAPNSVSQQVQAAKRATSETERLPTSVYYGVPIGVTIPLTSSSIPAAQRPAQSLPAEPMPQPTGVTAPLDELRPPPKYDGREFHWLETNGVREPRRPVVAKWARGMWHRSGFTSPPAAFAQDGYRYIAPAEPPQEAVEPVELLPPPSYLFCSHHIHTLVHKIAGTVTARWCHDAGVWEVLDLAGNPAIFTPETLAREGWNYLTGSAVEAAPQNAPHGARQLSGHPIAAEGKNPSGGAVGENGGV